MLWLALTAIALTSLVGGGAGTAAGARVLAASAVAKFKASAPGVPTTLPRESNRTLGPQAHGPDGDAKRVSSSRSPLGLVPGFVTVSAIAGDEEAVEFPTAAAPPLPARPFAARAPPSPS
jgi:hypothetical protein